MSNSNSEAGNQTLIKKEFALLLHLFTLATCEKDLFEATIKCICSYSNSVGGFYVSCSADVSEDDPIEIVAVGICQPFDEYRLLSMDTDFKKNRQTFHRWASSFGWNDLSLPFEVDDQESKSSSIYCVPVRCGDNRLVGFLGIQNKKNPFRSSESEAIAVFLTTLNMRLSSAKGSFNSEEMVINKIVHDINGGLSIVGLQNELLNFQKVTQDLTEVRSRIKQGLLKIETAVKQLHDLTLIFFNKEVPLNLSSAKATFNAAMVFSPFNANSRSKVQSSINIIDEDLVGIDVVVLFWLYLNFLYMWANPDSWNPNEPVEMLVELKYESANKKNIVLELARLGCPPTNFQISHLSETNHGCFDSGLIIMSRASVLNFFIMLFGGALTFTEQSNVQVISISLPLVS